LAVTLVFFTVPASYVEAGGRPGAGQGREVGSVAEQPKAGKQRQTAAAVAITAEQIEADWLRQDELWGKLDPSRSQSASICSAVMATAAAV